MSTKKSSKNKPKRVIRGLFELPDNVEQSIDVVTNNIFFTNAKIQEYTEQW